MANVFIQPRVDHPSSNDVIQLAVELGEFRITSGCAFDVAYTDATGFALKVTYWQDETFTALRLKFGHMFVEDPMAKPKHVATSKKSALPASPAVTRPKVRPLTSGEQPDQWVDDPEWKKMIWQLSQDDVNDKTSSTHERLKTLQEELNRRRVTARYA